MNFFQLQQRKHWSWRTQTIHYSTELTIQSKSRTTAALVSSKTVAKNSSSEKESKQLEKTENRIETET